MHTEEITPAPVARSRRRGPREKLAEALIALAQHSGRITQHVETGWASITFAGTRHRVAIMFEGEGEVEAGEYLIAALPDHEFAIPGQLVADATVTDVDHRLDPPRMAVTCELLLLEEG